MPHKAPPLYIVVVAAGRGSRMGSIVPKALLKLDDRTMIEHVIEKARTFEPAGVIVVEAPGGPISSRLAFEDVTYVCQPAPNGVAEAVELALAQVSREATVLVLLGDSPLFDAAAVRELLSRHRQGDQAATLLTGRTDRAIAFSIVMRDEAGAIIALRKTKPTAQANEYSLGPLVFTAESLRRVLPAIKPINGERQLEVAIELLAATGHRVESYLVASDTALWGVNTPEELAAARDRYAKGAEEQ